VPELCARPIRIVVPSRSLRLHVGSAIARHHGAVLGLVVQTHVRLASDVLAAAGEATPSGGPLLDLLVRRLARADATLHGELDHLVDGYGALIGTVRDLLDAGFMAGSQRSTERLLGRPSGPAGRRARALVGLAAATDRALTAAGAGGRAALLRRAARMLRATPALLSARCVYVYGYADATGLVTELLRALIETHDACVLMDRPPDPSSPERVDTGVAFTDRFVGRLQSAPDRPVTALGDGPASEPEIRLVAAPGTVAEVRAAAIHVRDLLAAGVAPEAIAIVGRSLMPYRTAIRAELDRLGIPFSAVSASVPGPESRRAAALAVLLRARDETPVGRWVDACARIDSGRAPDLRVALKAMGVARLRDLARVDLDSHLHGDRLALPVRRGLRVPELGEGPRDEDRPPRADRRRVHGSELRRLLALGRELTRRLASWPARASVGRHLGQLSALCREDLGFEEDSTGASVLARLATLATELPAGFQASLDEILTTFSTALDEVGDVPLGGAGGGVQVLDVTEARARTFEHLFVLGLGRDRFPRLIREDPLLPDRLRLELRRALPDLPVKRGPGFDEERFLFAQLVASSPHVTLAWQSVDDDGRQRPPSPLVERLHWRRSRPVVHAPDRHATATAAQTASEHAVCAGLFASRKRFGHILEVALAEAAIAAGNTAALAPAVAHARVAVLSELDPDRRTRAGNVRAQQLGPFFGFVGRPRVVADPRRRPLHATGVENVAACPWKFFLESLLGLEPLPDPLAALPGLEPVVVGQIVHDVLERLVAPDPLESELAELAQRPATAIAWPDADRLEASLREAAARALRATGAGPPEMVSIYVEVARPMIDAARRIDWAYGPVPVLGAEVHGTISEVSADGRSSEIGFRADRVDREGDALRLTDYKTGRPFSTAARLASRRRAFLAEVEHGRRLQPVVYAVGGGAGATGRLLYLGPDVDDVHREVRVEARDTELIAAFRNAARVVQTAVHDGAMFPRLVEIKTSREPRLCGFCGVAEACVRGDSGARVRLEGWVARRLTEGHDIDERHAERALIELYGLGEAVAGDPS